MKVALIQLKAGTNKKANLSTALSLVHKAAKNSARFIVLPEVFLYRGQIKNWAELKEVAEDVEGQSLEIFRIAAKKHNVYILAGSIFEKSKTKKVYNTSVLISPSGRTSAVYRKQNLFEAIVHGKHVREADVFLAGNKLTTAKVDNFKIGLSICYDLRFPLMFRMYAKKDVDIICVPSAFTRKTGRAHWETLLRARAIENLCYVIAPNQYGKDNRGILCYAHSMIIDPWGKVLASAPKQKTQIIYADIDKNMIRHHRNVFPSWKAI